jgi:sec-independent protein translocase protein TatC
MDTLTEFAQDYLPYLEDARRRIVFTAVVFAALFVAGFFASPYIIKALVALLQFPGVEYAVLSPFQLLSTSFDVGLFFAVTFSLPLIVAEVYEFLASAFTKKERAAFRGYLLLSVLLFVVGFAYGAAVLYYAASVVSTWNASLGLANVWDIDGFISESLLTASLLGVLFEYPLLLSGLMRTGVLRRDTLVRGRKVAVAATVIIVALLPPTDGLSLIIMSVPLLGMYELTLLLAREGKRQVVPAPVAV